MNTENTKSNKIIKIIKTLNIFIIFSIILLSVLNYDKLTVENILKYTPDNKVLASFVILLLYVIKSISIVFPSAILYISTGKIFTFYTALLINSLGLLIILSIPYILGRIIGPSFVESIRIKYPKSQSLIDFKDNNGWFFVILTRIFKVIPGDIASILLGSLNIDYPLYLSLSFLVRFPPMLSNTFLGLGIQTNKFTGFFLSMGLTLTIALISNIIYFKFTRSNNKTN